jgi:hypothetical protein
VHEGRGQFLLILAGDHTHHMEKMFGGKIPKCTWHLLLCQKGSCHVNHKFSVGFNKAISGLMAPWTGNNGRPFEMKERMDMAPKTFLVAVTLELLGKTTGFSPKFKESSNDVVTTKGFQTKTPIIPGGPEGRSLYCHNLTCRAPLGRLCQPDLTGWWRDV